MCLGSCGSVAFFYPGVFGAVSVFKLDKTNHQTTPRGKMIFFLQSEELQQFSHGRTTKNVLSQ